MKRLSRYVSTTVALSALVVFVGFMGLDVIFRVIGETDNVSGNYTFFKAVVYELLNTPARVYQMMPIVGLIACLTGLGSLANTSELVVIRAAGVSSMRILWMALRPIFIMMFIAILLGEYVAPQTEQMAQSYRSEARNRSSGNNLQRGLWLRDGDDFVFVNVVKADGTMLGVNIFSFSENHALAYVRRAQQAVFHGDYWQLAKVQTTHVALEKPGEKSNVSKTWQKQMQWQSSLNPELLSIAVVEPKDLSLRHLFSYIGYLKQQSLSSVEYELAFWNKVFYPLVMFSLVLVGVSFVFGPLREVSMGYRVFWGVLVGVLFKTVQDALAPLSIVFGFSPMLAMLAPSLLCMLIGAYLLYRAR